MVIHWHKRFSDKKNAGMAFVCLSRCQKRNDIHIKGKVDPAGIHASPEALEETKRLDKIFDDNVKKQNDLKESHWIISYLNVRSLKCHKEDVKIDNVIMESDVFSLGETWLNPGETVNFDSYTGHFANFGRGKGVAAFSKMAVTKIPIHVLPSRESG